MPDTHIPYDLVTAIRVMTHLGTDTSWPEQTCPDEKTYQEYVTWLVESNMAGSFFQDDPVLTPEGLHRLNQLEFAYKALKQVLRKTPAAIQERVGQRLLWLYMNPNAENLRAIALFEAAMRAYLYLARIKQYSLSPQTLTTGLGLIAISRLGRNKHLPSSLKDPIMLYLYRLPGYCLVHTIKTDGCREEHKKTISTLGLRRFLRATRKRAVKSVPPSRVLGGKRHACEAPLRASV